MGVRRRGCAWLFLIGGLAGVALFVTFLFLLPSLLNLDVVKDRMIALAFEELGATLGYEKAELSLFPRPRIVIYQGSLTEPGEMEIRAEKLTAETSLLSLLEGNFELMRIRVEAPVLKLELSGEGGEDSGLSVQEGAREGVVSVVSVLTSKVPGFSVELEEGTFELCREDRSLFRGEDLRARVDSRPDPVRVDLFCRSRLWEGLSLKGSIGETLKGACKIQLRGLASASILEGLVPPALARLEPADLDVEFSFDGHDADRFEGKFRGSLPSLRQQSPDRQRILEGLDVSGSLRFDSGRMLVSLNRLTLDFPGLKSSGELSVDSDPPHVSLEAKGEGIDLLELRQVALIAGAENPRVQEICEYVGEGEVSSVVVRSEGPSLADLGSLENLSVKARFRGARILVRDPGLELRGVGGDIALSPGTIEGKDLAGSLGKSSFSGVTALLELDKTPYLRHLSGDLDLSLGEIHRRLASLEAFREATKEVKAVRGTMALRVKSLSGPVEKPDKWNFEAGGVVKGLVVETSLLPGPVKVPKGSLQANRKSILLEGVCVDLLDAKCVVSGRLDGYREGLQRMEWKLNGTVGPEANRWVSEQIELPPEFHLRAPYKVSRAVFEWEKGKDSLVRGILLSPLGPRVSMDLSLKPETVVVNDLSIEDEASKASLRLTEMENAFFVAFQGRLEKETLDDLLLENEFLAGRVEGDLETKIFMDHPLESKATGTLRAEALSLPLPVAVPVRLEDLSLRAQGSQVTMERVRLVWEEEQFVLGGDVSFSSEGFVLDLDALAGDLDWDKIQEALGHEEAQEEALLQADSRKRNSLDSLTVGGVVRVKADSLTFEGLTFRPAEVEIRLQGEGIEIIPKEADLCGVSTVGALEVLPTELSLDLAVMCRDKRIEEVLDCIQIDADATGDLSFRVKLSGRGKAEDLLQWLQGDFELSCRKGTILRDRFLFAVLAFLDAREILRLRLPDLAKQGFAYNSIQARGIIQKGELQLKEVFIDGRTVDIYAVGKIDMVGRKLDVRVLASSFKTVELILSRIPLVSYLLGGRGVMAVPMRVYGPLDNPKTVPLSPMALGEDLLRIMGRALGLPYVVVKGFFPTEEEQAEVQ
jgi:hypothetical protein